MLPDKYTCDGQMDFIEQGFGREKCLIDKTSNCTKYWAGRTKEACGNGFCEASCCYGCKEQKTCGYACNTSNNIEKRVKQ